MVQQRHSATRLLGSKTIPVAQGFAQFQSAENSYGEADLTGNDLAKVAPVPNHKLYAAEDPLAEVIN